MLSKRESKVSRKRCITFRVASKAKCTESEMRRAANRRESKYVFVRVNDVNGVWNVVGIGGRIARSLALLVFVVVDWNG